MQQKSKYLNEEPNVIVVRVYQLRDSFDAPQSPPHLRTADKYLWRIDSDSVALIHVFPKQHVHASH